VTVRRQSHVPSSWHSRYIVGWLAGRNPKDDEFSVGAPTDLHLAHRHTRRVRVHCRPGWRQCEGRGAPAFSRRPPRPVCIVANPHLHVTEALRTTLDEAVAMARELGGVFARRACRCFSTPSTSSTATARAEFAIALIDARASRAERSYWCDTNAGRFRRVGGSSVEVRAGPLSASGFTSQRLPAAPSPTHSSRFGSARNRSRAVSTATAKFPATPISPPPSQPPLSRWDADDPAERLERLTPVSGHIASSSNPRRGPQQAYVGPTPSPTRRACTRAPLLAAPMPTGARHTEFVGNGRALSSRRLAGRSTLFVKLELGTRSTARVLAGPSRHEGLEHGGTLRGRDGSLELLCERGWRGDATVLPHRSFRVITDWRSRWDAPRPLAHLFSPGELTTEPTVKVHRTSAVVAPPPPARATAR